MSRHCNWLQVANIRRTLVPPLSVLIYSVHQNKCLRCLSILSFGPLCEKCSNYHFVKFYHILILFFSKYLNYSNSVINIHINFRRSWLLEFSELYSNIGCSEESTEHEKCSMKIYFDVCAAYLHQMPCSCLCWTNFGVAHISESYYPYCIKGRDSFSAIWRRLGVGPAFIPCLAYHTRGTISYIRH